MRLFALLALVLAGIMIWEVFSSDITPVQPTCPARPAWTEFKYHMEGRGGDDTLIGGDFPERLDGGEDNDLISGGGGDDLIIGGAGQDRFAYDQLQPSGFDKIVDFELGDDTIILNPALSIQRIYEDEGSSLVLLSNGGCIELAGVLGLPEDRSAYIAMGIPDVLLQPGDDWKHPARS